MSVCKDVAISDCSMFAVRFVIFRVVSCVFRGSGFSNADKDDPRINTKHHETDQRRTEKQRLFEKKFQ